MPLCLKKNNVAKIGTRTPIISAGNQPLFRPEHCYFVFRFTLKTVGYFYMDFDRLLSRDHVNCNWPLWHSATDHTPVAGHCLHNKHVWLEITAVLNPSEFYDLLCTYIYSWIRYDKAMLQPICFYNLCKKTRPYNYIWK